MAHCRINELDAADRVLDGYSVICRSDAAALAMASKGAENRADTVEVWENTRHVARPDPPSPWHRLRSQWAGQPSRACEPPRMFVKATDAGDATLGAHE
jgi:hypothetical protein